MRRRHFVRQTLLGALAVPVLSLQSCSGPSVSKKSADTTTDPSSAFPYEEATIQDLQQQLSAGKFSSKDLVEAYLKQVEALDKNGPKLNSVIELNPDALRIAEALDQERKDGKVRGPLHGIPVMIKDNIDTADKMMTTAGALALEGNIATQDAFIVKRLRDVGAIIIGKTNLSEWANFRSTRSVSGWSSRGGQTKNPYVLDRNPCGSSSGSGTAVAANLCVAAIGTETNGSIACPSSVNGVVGIKPTVGLVSRSGIIPISHTQDTAGPMTRTVADAAIVLSAITGIDERDEATSNSEGHIEADYSKFLSTNGLKGKIIGVEKSMLKGHEDVDVLFANAIEQIKQAGATIVEVDLIKATEVGDNEYEVLLYEFKEGVNQYLAKANAKVKSVQDVIEFNKQNESRAMPFFKQEILESANAKDPLTSSAYRKALDKVLSVRKAIDGIMQENKLDAICGPANGPTWCTDLVNGDHFTGYGMYSPGAMAGYPHITVPMGYVDGLPVGLTFMAGAWQEPKLIEIGYAYEQVSRHRTKPGFKTTLA